VGSLAAFGLTAVVALFTLAYWTRSSPPAEPTRELVERPDDIRVIEHSVLPDTPELAFQVVLANSSTREWRDIRAIVRLKVAGIPINECRTYGQAALPPGEKRNSEARCQGAMGGKLPPGVTTEVEVHSGSRVVLTPVAAK